MLSLVFVHGAGEDSRIWQRQCAFFAGSHNVIDLDLPGRHRRLAERPLDSHEDNARDVGRQMDDRRIGWAVIVGHSMGGAVALTLALEHPERVQALVLVASGARLRMSPELMDKARRRADGTDVGTDPIVPIERLVAASTPADLRHWIAERALTAPPATTYADFRANDGFDVMDRVSGLAVPTLVIVGDEDRMAPPKFSEFLAKNIPGSRLTILDRCGHYPQVEREPAFTLALEKFLTRLPRH